MELTIVALCVLVAWQFAVIHRLRLETVQLTEAVAGLESEYDWLDVGCEDAEATCKAQKALLRSHSYICDTCDEVTPNVIPAVPNYKRADGETAGEVTFTCGACADGVEGDALISTRCDVDFIGCAVCESRVAVLPETNGPCLCCFCRADIRADAGGVDLPLPSDAEVDWWLADLQPATADDPYYDCASCGGGSVEKPSDRCSWCALGVAGSPCAGDPLRY